MLIRTQSKATIIDVTGKRVKITATGDKRYWEISTFEPLQVLGYYLTKEIAQQVLDDIEIAWSKWTPGSPAYHMPEDNGVADMSDMEKAEAIQKSKAMTPEFYGDWYADGHLVYDKWKCPGCGKSYETDGENYNYCPSCGQKIDWSEYDK